MQGAIEKIDETVERDLNITDLDESFVVGERAEVVLERLTPNSLSSQ